jgi:hypothetical protein
MGAEQNMLLIRRLVEGINNGSLEASTTPRSSSGDMSVFRTAALSCPVSPAWSAAVFPRRWHRAAARPAQTSA